jgi:hypothetical protein
MQPKTENPLAKHFRQPAIYMDLPSKGAYWPENAVDLGVNSQIAVYPMTTKDEITIRTPDALLNGQSVVSLIQSCCPQIKNAWAMPSIDVDAILIGIRIASYGSDMEIDSICTNQACKHDNRHTFALNEVLDNIKAPDYTKPLDVAGLKIKLRPQPYFEANKTNLANFEANKLIQIVNDENMPEEEKLMRYKIHMEKMVDINLQIITGGTEYIESEGQQVTDPKFIKELYENADTKLIKAVRDRFDQYFQIGALPKPKVVCEACDGSYNVEIVFDYNNFFASAS